MTARILVTGSRSWDSPLTIASVLAEECAGFGYDVLIVHGACPAGADQMADLWARHHQVPVERHPADWATMVGLGADLCLAFIKDGSKGATHTAELAEQAGIETRRFV